MTVVLGSSCCKKHTKKQTNKIKQIIVGQKGSRKDTNLKLKLMC